jgi:stalled ribosome alternative rescue factor ArfA
MKTRNPVAKYCGLVNKPKVFRAAKGPGSYQRDKKVPHEQ